MKTIGLLGGMSWESTVSYYQAINQRVSQQLGSLHSAKIALYSVDFAEIEQLQHQGEWQQTAQILTDAAKQVQAAGADFLLICTNTMHKVADEVAANIDIPLLHIADATAEQLVKDGINKVGLLGTQFTMAQDFYKGRLQHEFDIDVVVPTDAQQRKVHDVIYNQLCLGQIVDESRDYYLKVIDDLTAQGAQAIILGCTEIALLVKPQDTKAKLYDTVAIHAKAAVDMAI